MADALTLGLGQGSSNASVAKIAIEQRKKKMDVVEPQVISEELLKEGVDEPIRPDGAPCEPIDFPSVISLRLSFSNIIEISNLNNFDALTTLRLDNNIIDKIANLGHLRNLTWLDLSFNNIRDIEGLENLGNLLDLSLYHNQIEEIKGLDGCPKLNILSLGHNNIKDLKQIDQLRRFQNLRCVCLDGNKVCQHDSYNQHVLAYLPNLKYLDYMLIDRKAVAQAQEGYNLDELTEVREKEQADQALQKQRVEKALTVEKLRSSFLDCTADLFEELFSKQSEPEHVHALSCFPQFKEDYRERLTDDVRNLRSRMEEKNEARLKKVSAFERSVAAAEKASEDEAFQAIRDFMSMKKKVLAHLERDESGAATGMQRADVEALTEKLSEQLTVLESHLMANEVQLQESIEEALGDFEGQIGELVKKMSEAGSDFFRGLEEQEKLFAQNLMDGANAEIEAFMQQNLDSSLAEVDQTKARYLSNREELNQALANFTEQHTSLIQMKDDQMQNQMKSWEKTFSDKHRERQYHRNRQRITDIKKVVDECREEIAATTDNGDDDYEHEGEGPYGR